MYTKPAGNKAVFFFLNAPSILTQYHFEINSVDGINWHFKFLNNRCYVVNHTQDANRGMFEKYLQQNDSRLKVKSQL